MADTPDLPSLPDGGLGTNMPAWLRRAPSFAVKPPDPIEPPKTFESGSLTVGLELPGWLADLSARVDQELIEPRWHRPPAEPLASGEPVVKVPAQEDLVVETLLAPEPPARSTPELESAPVPLHFPVSLSVAEEPVTPGVEPPYGRIALLVLVVAAALLFIALWAMLA